MSTVIEEIADERIDVLNTQAWNKCRLDTAEALRLSQEALDLSLAHSYEKGQLEAKLNFAQCFWLKGEYFEAIDRLVGIMPQLKSRDYLKLYAESVNLLASIYSSMDKFQEAENYYREAMDMRRKLNDGEGTVRTMNGLGDLYMKQAQYQWALDLFLDALRVEHSNETIKGIVVYNIAETSCHLEKYDDCEKSITECLALGEKLQFPLMMIYSKSLLAKIRIKQNQYAEAAQALYEALQLAEKIENSARTSAILLELSKVYELMGDVPKAFSYFKRHHELHNKLLELESKERLSAIEHREKLEAARKEAEQQRLRNLELKEANHTIEAVKNVLAQKNSEITDSIKYASRIQEAMLPSEELVNSLFPENFIMYRPKEILSGDFYWVSEATTNYKERIAMAAVVDCTGHGVPAALMGMIGNNFLRICEHEPTVNRPSEALDFINVGVSSALRQEYSKSKIRDGMDMAFVAVDYSKMVMHFAGAKNPVYLVRNNELIEYKGDKHPIGAFVGEQMLKFTNVSVPVQKGDCIYLFSDGYADQFGGPKGKKFMYKRFKEMLLKNCLLPMKEQQEILVRTFEEWKGKLDQIDDVCVMGIRI